MDVEKSVDEATGMSEAVVKKLDDKVSFFERNALHSFFPGEDAHGCTKARRKERAGRPGEAR